MQVHAGPCAALLPERVVAFNKISVVFSSFFLLNLASMPLKAYLAEPFPWMPRLEPSFGIAPRANETFAVFEVRTLAVCVPRYTSHTHASGHNYLSDATEAVDVLYSPLHRATEATFAYENLPGALFYSRRARLWVRDASLGNRNTSGTALVQPGTLFGRPLSITVIWIDLHDNIFFAAHVSRGSAYWLYAKFGARVGMTLRIVYLLWTRYYVHYRSLAIGLRRYGTCGKTERLEIIVGDPTCLILQNTCICVVFVIDFWCSPDLAAQSFVRINQTSDLWTFSVATLYLARTVWFGYLALNLSGYVLRRLGLESKVAQADPTGVAIAVALAVGPLTYYQLRLSFVIDIYHALYTMFLPDSEQWSYTEGVPPAILYTILLGALPLVYTFAWPALQRLLRYLFGRVQAIAKTSRWRLSHAMSRSSLVRRAMDRGAFGRWSYNDWKHRVLLGLIFGCCCCRRKRRAPTTFRGGSIYKLFTTHRHLQRNAAFSFRGSDCYVLSHTPNSVVSYRLSLSDALYLEHTTGIVLSTSNATAFGRLGINPNGTIQVVVGADRSSWLL